MRDDEGFMRRWEYCHVLLEFGQRDFSFVRYDVAGAARTRVRKDEASGDEETADAAYRLIAQLGLDGWEMVSGSDALQMNLARLYVFKRPLS